jgi:predicted acyl esterase
MRFVSRIGFILFFCFSFVVWNFAEIGNGQNREIDIILEQKIPMKDGIHLSARIWKPADMDAPLPAIFVLTPYVSDEAQQRATFFAQNGYVYVSVDCRGRGNSEGEFYPFEQDGPDGAQVVE